MSDPPETSTATATTPGRPSKNIIWDHVKIEDLDETVNGKATTKQTCVHCGRSKTAQQFLTTWWSCHFVDRAKGCPNCPEPVRVAILNNTSSTQVREVAAKSNSYYGLVRPIMALGGRSVGRPRKNAPPPMVEPSGPGRLITKLLTDSIELEPQDDGTVKQTCRHCKKTKTAKQYQATAWSMHLVDISFRGCQACPLYIRKAIAEATSSADVRKLATEQGWFGMQQSAAAAMMVSGGGGAPHAAKRQKLMMAAAANQFGIGATTTDATMYAGNTAGTFSSRNTAASIQSTVSSNVAAARAALSMGICTEDQAKTISMKIMQFLAGCGQSFLLVQSPLFLDMLRALNSDYVTRHLGKADVFVNHWLPQLYEAVQKDLAVFWKQQKANGLCTLGLWEGLPSVTKNKIDEGSSTSVKVMTEGIADKVAFLNTVPASEETETADGMGKLLANHMISKSGGEETGVEENYTAFVTKTSELNVEVGKVLQERFPKLFINGCRLQASRDLKYGIFHIPDISQTFSDAQFVANFVLDHAHTSTAFASIAQDKGGSMPEAAESQDFAQVTNLLETVCGPENANTAVFKALLREPQWIATSSQTIDPQLVQYFESLVSDEETFARFRALLKLMKVLSIFDEHLTRSELRASWLVPLFEALLKDASEWSNDDSVRRAFKKEETFDLLTITIKLCWRGDPPQQPGLYSPQILMATLLDPTTCPDSDSLPQDWENECEEVLKRFYDGKELLDANGELMTLLDHQEKFGREVERYKEAIKNEIPDPEGRSHVQQVVDHQLPSRESRPNLIWKLSLKSSFPLLFEISRRVLVMGTASGDSSWTGKLQAAVNSKVGKGLTNKNVLMLLYCNINLRHTTSSQSQGGEEVDYSFDNFLDQALLERIEEPDDSKSVDSNNKDDSSK